MTAVVDHEEPELRPGERKPRRRDRVRQSILAIIGLLWTAGVAWFTARLWPMLADASPVIAMFEAENGGPLTETEWYNFEEAKEIFWPHPDSDPATNRIGRHIDASWVYSPLLVIGGWVTFLTGALLSYLNLRSADARLRMLTVLMVTVFAVSLIPILLYGDVIGALTAINE